MRWGIKSDRALGQFVNPFAMADSAAAPAPEGDVFRLYALLGQLREQVRVQAQQLEDVRRQFDDVHARLTNLEPASEASALVALGTGATVPMQTHGDVYDASALLQALFTPEGALVYNTTNPEHPKGFARGAYPDACEPAKCVFVCGDDYNEHSVSLYHFLLWPTVLAHKDHGEGLRLYLSRVGREKTSEELAQDALVVPHCPSVVVELCGFRSLGYEAIFQAAVHIAHGRKTFVVFPDQKLELTRFRTDLKETNFIGARLSFTERERQTELQRLLDALLGVYEKHFSNSVRRVCREGMCHFVTHVGNAHRGYIHKQTEPTDAGFCASWLSAVAGIQARTDVGLLFKALISVIVTERGGHTTQSADEMAEHHRLLQEASYTPVTQSITSRNLELKNAFVNAVGVSPVLASLVRL